MTSDLLSRLDAALGDSDPQVGVGVTMRGLLRAGLDRLPRPGSGETLLRWRALARVARHDLSLVKLYEAHTDALAILAEIEPGRDSCGNGKGDTANLPDRDAPAPDADRRSSPAGLWAVWAAEAPQGRTGISTAAGSRVQLAGSKCWCSGADDVQDALLTAWLPDGRGPQLVHLRLAQTGISLRHDAWQARGMAGAVSPDLDFERAEARLVGSIGDYVARPGFSQGGAGIAACWYGGAVAVAEFLRQSVADVPAGSRHPLRLAALGRVAQSLRACAAVLREAADWIDRNPAGDASSVALQARLSADACARLVLDEVSRALGPAPLCRDARFARFAADLPIFIRQCQGDRDFEALGLRESEVGDPWTL